MSQLTTSLTNWLEDMSIGKLSILEFNLKRVIAIKRLITQKEKENKSLDEQLLGFLYLFTGKSKQEAKEERRREIMELNKLLKDQRVRNISKLDIPSLRDLGRMTDKYIERKLKQEAEQELKRLFEPYTEKLKRKVEEYKRLDREKEEARIRKEEEKKRKEARKARSDTEKRTEKYASLQRKGIEFKDFLDEGEDVRVSDIPFTEPAPGCKYNIGESTGYVIIPLTEQLMKDFLIKSYEYLMNVAEQLYDGIGKRISLNLMSVSLWSRIMEGEEGSELLETHTHNTKFRSFISRNQIKEKCDEVIKMLMDKMMMPQGKSGLSFKVGDLIRIEYYANLSNELKTRSRKNRGGQWVDHKSIPCFTAKVRTEDIKAMDNYTVNKPTYIYNIKNTNDDLCFIRYMIVVKFLSKLKKFPYLIHDDPKEKFKDYYTSYHLPGVNPENLGVMDLFFPFICYPDKEINSIGVGISMETPARPTFFCILFNRII